MTQFEIMEQVKTELTLSEEQYSKYSNSMKYVLEYLEEKQITLVEGSMLAFLAHIVTLFIRLETGEKVQEMGSEVLNQLDERAVALTRELMGKIETEYGPADTSELILVSIHIQTALETMK